MDQQPPTLEWRTLSPSDISHVVAIASTIHPGLPERDAVFLERVVLFPEGCLGLFKKEEEEEQSNNHDDKEDSSSNQQQLLCGYLISHPIRRQQPPDLDTLLGNIASDADQYYLHDLAILPECRGTGMAQRGVEKVLRTAAKRYETSCLVSVYGTTTFWGKFGFREPEAVDAGLEGKLRGYGDGARYLERKNGY